MSLIPTLQHELVCCVQRLGHANSAVPLRQNTLASYDDSMYVDFEKGTRSHERILALEV